MKSETPIWNRRETIFMSQERGEEEEDEDDEYLEGSPSKDRFKMIHKRDLSDNQVALDIDFALVTRRGQRRKNEGIICFFDFKLEDDDLTPMEIMAYNELRDLGYPIYIIQAQASNKDEYLNKTDDEIETEEEVYYNIYKYVDGIEGWGWKKSTISIMKRNINWEEYERWENELRRIFSENGREGVREFEEKLIEKENQGLPW